MPGVVRVTMCMALLLWPGDAVAQEATQPAAPPTPWTWSADARVVVGFNY